LAGIWLIVTQWIASAVGGYLTGRLRIRWADLHTHEVFFRDTAHGFLTWAVATLLVALVVTSAPLLAAGAVTRVGSSSVAPATEGAYAYDLDVLFRGQRPEDSAFTSLNRAEAGRILAASTAPKSMTIAHDRLYLAEVVAQRTGLPLAAAQRRVDVAIADARQAAEKTRRAASATAIFTALAMVIGAFVACVAAALGGQRRDQHA
jgi:hypothetical protein